MDEGAHDQTAREGWRIEEGQQVRALLPAGPPNGITLTGWKEYAPIPNDCEMVRLARKAKQDRKDGKAQRLP